MSQFIRLAIGAIVSSMQMLYGGWVAKTPNAPLSGRLKFLPHIGTFPSNPQKKVSNDSDVENEHDNLGNRRMPMYLVNLKRQQRSCDDNSKPLSPGFHQPQTEALCQEECGINKTPYPEVL